MVTRKKVMTELNILAKTVSKKHVDTGNFKQYAQVISSSMPLVISGSTSW